MQELAQNFVDGHEDGIENVHFSSFCLLPRARDGPADGTALFTRLELTGIVAPQLRECCVQNYGTQTTCATGFATLKGLLRHRALLTLTLYGTIPTEEILLTRGSLKYAHLALYRLQRRRHRCCGWTPLHPSRIRGRASQDPE